VKAKMARPLRYKTVEELQNAIDAYFKSCEGEPYMVKDPDTGEETPLMNKYGDMVLLNVKPPTVTGLALALGFTTRQSLLNYQAKKQFVDTITRAKSYIEAYAEGRLFDKDGCNGAKFSLSNNFKGWSEHPDTSDNEALTRLDEILNGIHKVMHSD